MSKQSCCEVVESRSYPRWDVVVADRFVRLSRKRPLETAVEIWEIRDDKESLRYGFIKHEERALIALTAGRPQGIRIRNLPGDEPRPPIEILIEPPPSVEANGKVTWPGGAISPAPRHYHVEIRDARTGDLLREGCATGHGFDLATIDLPSSVFLVSARSRNAVTAGLLVRYLGDSTSRLVASLQTSSTSPWYLVWKCPGEVVVEHETRFHSKPTVSAGSGEGKLRVAVGDKIRFTRKGGGTLTHGALCSDLIEYRVVNESTLQLRTGRSIAPGPLVVVVSEPVGWLGEGIAAIRAAYDAAGQSPSRIRLQEDDPHLMEHMQACVRDGCSNPKGLAPRALVEDAAGLQGAKLSSIFGKVTLDAGIRRAHRWLCADRISSKQLRFLHRFDFWHEHRGAILVPELSEALSGMEAIWKDSHAVCRAAEAISRLESAHKSSACAESDLRPLSGDESRLASSTAAREFWSALGQSPLLASEVRKHIPAIEGYRTARQILEQWPDSSAAVSEDVFGLPLLSVHLTTIREETARVRSTYEKATSLLPHQVCNRLPDVQALDSRVRKSLLDRLLTSKTEEIENLMKRAASRALGLASAGLLDCVPGSAPAGLSPGHKVAVLMELNAAVDAGIARARARVSRAPVTVLDDCERLIKAERWRELAQRILEFETDREARAMIDRLFGRAAPTLPQLLQWIPDPEGQASMTALLHAARILASTNDGAPWDACIDCVATARERLFDDFSRRVRNVLEARGERSPLVGTWSWAEAARRDPSKRVALRLEFPEAEVLREEDNRP